MKFNKLFNLILWIILSAQLANGSEGNIATVCEKNENPKEYLPDNIYVNKSSLTLKVGESEQLTATSDPAVAHEPAFQWESENNAIATVNNGLVKAIKTGETSVIVKYNGVSTIIPVKVEVTNLGKRGILYTKTLNNYTSIPEILLNDAGKYTTAGLCITQKGKMVKLDKFYAIAERMIQYRIKFSDDAKAIFKSSEGDFNAYIDVSNKRISIATSPVTNKTVDFLQGGREYLIEIYHIYQKAKIRIVDVQTGEEAEISATNDGQGGCGKGLVHSGFNVGMQWDKYCFGLDRGSSMLVKQITVYVLKNKVRLLIYGDSISQPEGYFPTKDFPNAWTQLIINKLDGNAMSSGRGGGTIDMVLGYIKNELPYIETKYVMVTIGTNGGNTEAKLKELVSYIKSQGAIPILNNTPSNESSTQTDINNLIDKVRQYFGIKGCMLDMATSINGDGKEVDKTMMFWEDYSGSYGWQIYHHPNAKGGKKIFERTMIDIPEIYK